MPLQVPIKRTPDSRPVAAQEGYAQAVPDLDLSPITGTIRAFAKELEDEKKKAEAFDLQRRFMQETNDLMQDFQTRQEEAPLGANGFTDTVLSDYETRHTTMLDNLWREGYDTESLQELSLRLGSLRQNFGERALVFQAQSTGALADKEMGEFDVLLSQYATSNPDGYASAVEEAREGWFNRPGITDEQALRGFERSQGVIRQGAMRGLAMQNPGLIIEKLDPNGLTAPVSATGSNPLNPANGAGPNAYEMIRNFEGFRESTYWDVNHHRTGYGSDTITLADGTVREVQPGDRVTREDADRDLERRLGELSATAAQKVGDGWIALPEGAKSAVLSVAYNYGAGSSRLQPLWDAARSGDPTAVASVIESFAGDNNGANRDRRMMEAAAARSTVQTIDPGASTAEQAPSLASLTPPTGADGQPEQTFDLTSAQTGHPLLDALNGPERMQVLAWARETQNRATTQIKAAMDITIQNAAASISTGEYAGPQLTREQVLQVYGPLEGPQKWAQYEGSIQAGQVVQRIRTLNPTEIQREVTSLAPDPTSETYAVDLAKYQAAQTAAASIMSQREEDPGQYIFSAFPEIAQALSNASGSEQRKAAYAQLERAYERLGIPEGDRVAGSDAMIAELGDEYERQSATGRLSVIETALAEMGDMAGRTLGRAGGKEIARDIATYSILRRAPNGRALFIDVLRGKEIIAQDPARRPSASTINESFAGGLTGAINNLNPQVSRALNDAAAAIYVQRGGSTQKDANGNPLFDPDLYAASLREALGGSATNENTGVVDMRHSSTFSRSKVPDLTILPPGISRQNFENWIEGLQPGDLTQLNPQRRSPTDSRGRPLSIDTIIDEGVFVMLSPGIYGIKLDSDGNWIGDGHGGRFTVDLKTMRNVRAR